MGRNKRAARLLEEENGERLHDPKNLIGRYIMNTSKAAIILTPEESQNGFLISRGMYPMKEKLLKPFEFVWVDHMYFVATTTDGSSHGSYRMFTDVSEVSNYISELNKIT